MSIHKAFGGNRRIIRIENDWAEVAIERVCPGKYELDRGAHGMCGDGSKHETAEEAVERAFEILESYAS